MVLNASVKSTLHTEGGELDYDTCFFTRPLGGEKICCISFPLQKIAVQNNNCQTSAIFVFFWRNFVLFSEINRKAKFGVLG